MQEDHHMIVVKDRPLAAIKTDLIHAFLSVSYKKKKKKKKRKKGSIFCFLTHLFSYLIKTPDLVHNVLSSTQYRCEYRRPDRSSMFQRNIRFHVKFVQLNQPIHHYQIHTMLHLHLLLVRIK